MNTMIPFPKESYETFRSKTESTGEYLHDLGIEKAGDSAGRRDTNYKEKDS